MVEKSLEVIWLPIRILSAIANRIYGKLYVPKEQFRVQEDVQFAWTVEEQMTTSDELDDYYIKAFAAKLSLSVQPAELN